ncbi:conserved unknown protein [Ectocarpus siliculosus]|uniref:SET domain-containing protein n=1 Tax=Ectocarpus siliculosus TaxID=2880 RepID=D8LE87_ECTSI|nr:conserved unknown protein [Ectocarpus siliculosus]|eukprot:CBN74163.1 conserved unknown protein [Ectocarpus siliculosus]
MAIPTSKDEDLLDDEQAPAVAAAQDQELVAGSDAGTVAPSKKKKKKKKKKKSPQQNNQLAQVQVYETIKDLDTFKVTEDSVSGRCVIASRDLKAGELVLREPPFVKVVRRDCASRQCAYCCQQVTERGKIEADVPFAVYCSRACQAREDALRAAEASALGKLAGISAARDVDIDLLRMLLRLLITRAKALGLREPSGDSDSVSRGVDEEGEDGTMGEGLFLRQQWENLYALMHHREAMAPDWISVVREAGEDLLQLLPEWVRFDVEEVVQLACRVNVNAHGLRDDSGANLVIGVGMFPLTAMINHACRPNCTFVYFGGNLEVRTLEPVSAGAELSVYYIDLLQSTAARRQELLTSKHFLCKCSRCENPSSMDDYLDGVCCTDCGERGCLTPTPPPSAEDILAAQLAQLGEGLADESAANGSGMPLWRSLERKVFLWPESLLKSGSRTTMQEATELGAAARVSKHDIGKKTVATTMYEQLSAVLSSSPRGTRHLRRAVSAMEAVYPANFPELGDFHAALADANDALLQKRGQTLPKKSRSQAVSERKQALERAATIRSVCLGKDHPATREAARALDRVTG